MFFKYKESVFKNNNSLIILSAEFKLRKGKIAQIVKKMEFNLKKRKNQPEEPSAGCIFKNVEIKNFPQLKEIFKTYGDLKNIIKDGKIPAGWLIEKCGLKGKKIGQAKISEKHANFIVNLGKAKANDVLKLIDLIKKEVENKFKIRLEEEIEIVC